MQNQSSWIKVEHTYLGWRYFKDFISNQSDGYGINQNPNFDQKRKFDGGLLFPSVF